MNTKLTDQEVKEIRAKYIPYIRTQESLAQEYDMTRSGIQAILDRRTRSE